MVHDISSICQHRNGFQPPIMDEICQLILTGGGSRDDDNKFHTLRAELLDHAAQKNQLAACHIFRWIEEGE